MKKRVLSLLLTVVMVLGLLPAQAIAAELDSAVQPASYTTQANDTASQPVKPEGDASSEEGVMPLAETSTGENIAVHMVDSKGNYTHYDTARSDGTGYWAYVVPGMTIPTTVPGAVAAESATEGYTDYTYSWEGGSYIRMTLPTGTAASNLSWSGNVLHFTVGGKAYTLTLKDHSDGTWTLDTLLDKIKAEVSVSMTDTYDAVKAMINAVEMPEGIQMKANSIDWLHATAEVGTKENPAGKSGTIKLNVTIDLLDEADSSTVRVYSAKKAVHTIETQEAPLVYDESGKATITAEAYGPGTVEAVFDGMVAYRTSEGTFAWISQYTLTAAPNDKALFFQWDYTGDAPYELTSDNWGSHTSQKKIYIKALADQTITAYFAENAAPTVTSSAPTSGTAAMRTDIALNFLDAFQDRQTLTVGEKTYSRSDILTGTATLDGKELGVPGFDNFFFRKAFGEVGEHTLVVTATDTAGQSVSVTVPLTVTVSATRTDYKFNFTATYQGKDISWGEDGLNATVTYKAGPSGSFVLDNFDNEYFDTKNKYWFYIKNWSELRDSRNFYSLTIGDLEIMADDITTGWKNYKVNGKSRGFGICGNTDLLQIRFNTSTNITPTEDLNLQFNFGIPATYTPTVTVSEAGGGTIDSLKLYKNEETSSTWTLTTTPNLSWLLDYIQVGDDESTRVNSEDGKTIRWTVSKADQNYTAYFKEIVKAEPTDNWQLGQKGDWARRSISFGEKGYFVFNPYSSYTASTDYPAETEKNTMLYTELVNLSTEVDFRAEYPADTVFKGVLYNGEGTEGAVLDTREAKLQKALVPGKYGVDFTFNLPENPGKVTMVLTLGEGTEQAFTLTKTFDLTKAGITFRAPVESDYAKVVVQVGDKIGPTMVKDFKFYSGMKFLLGAYEDVLKKEADKGYKSIVIDSASGYMNTIVLSYDEPEIAGSVYTEKQFASGTWAWVTYLVNSWFVDLGIGSWGFFGNEIMQWSGLYSTVYGAPHTVAITTGDTWAVAVLRQYYTDAELLENGAGSTLLTAEQLAAAYPDHADEILNRQIVPNEIKPTFDAIVEKINAIGEVTHSSGEAIAAARKAYSEIPVTYFGSEGYFPALFDMCEPYKTAKKTLEDAEAAFAALKSPGGLVDAQIEAIGEVTLAKGSDILAARRAYDALTDEEKAKVTKLDTLTAAEQTYTDLQAAEQAALTDLNTIYTTTGNVIANESKFTVGSQSGEWAVIGLARAGKTVPAKYYDNVLAYVKANIDENGRLDPSKATDNARIILALTAIGKDITKVGEYDLLKGLNEMSYVKKQGINGAIFTLIALDSHDYTPAGDVTREKLIQVLLDAQLADGGWTLFGDTADADITGMAVTALAPYYTTNDKVKTALDKAIVTMSGMQKADGTFASSEGMGTAETTAQIITALAALKIDLATDSRFIKYGNSAVDGLRKFYVTGGGFRHTLDDSTKNTMATEQGYYALVANDRLVNKKNSLYNMNDVTIEGAAKPEDTAVTAVVEQIDAIGTVTLESKSAIEAAEAAYNALTSEQKAQVANYAKLTAARAAYDKLVADAAAAAAVVEQIDAIGTVTLESKSAIEAAEAAYNALTSEQKAQVTNYAKLTAARAAYDKLVADAAAAAAVVEQINAIGTVTLESKSVIEAAEAAYNALTSEQKAQVANYAKLTAARAAYDKLVAESRPVAPILPSTPSVPSTPSKPSTPSVPSKPAEPEKPAASFTDVKGHWAEDDIAYAVANGLMNGTGNSQFSPNVATTRGMIVTILARLEGVNTDGTGSWYAVGREWAVKLGISDGSDMEGQITREQLATMLYRYAQMKGYNTTARASLNGFTDASGVSDWAAEAMQWAVSVGLIGGRTSTTLVPQGTATRAEVAAILHRFVVNVAN